MISGQFAWEDAVYITSIRDEEGIASHRYYLLQSKMPEIPVEFLWTYYISQDGFDTLVRCSHGAAGRNRPLNIDELLKTNIPFPEDVKTIKTIIGFVRNYMNIQKKLAEKEQLLQEYKTRLISDVVTGKIDVRDIEIPEYEFVAEEQTESSADTEQIEEQED